MEAKHLRAKENFFNNVITSQAFASVRRVLTAVRPSSYASILLQRFSCL